MTFEVLDEVRLSSTGQGSLVREGPVDGYAAGVGIRADIHGKI